MEVLRELGLTAYEQKVYVALLTLGKGTASEISEKSKVPPTATYPALKQLTSRGFIQKFDGEPSLFEVVSPRKSITEYVSRKKKELEEIEKEAIAFSKQLLETPIKKPEKVLEIGSGSEFSREAYYISFENAKKSIYILGWRFDEVKDKYLFLRKIKAALKRGVEVKLILIGNEETKKRELVEAYKEAGVLIRFLPLENFSILISDDHSCKITIKKKGSEKVSMNILDKDFIGAMKSYYLDLWRKAREI